MLSDEWLYTSPVIAIDECPKGSGRPLRECQLVGAPPTSSFTLLYEVIGGDNPQSDNIEVVNGRFDTENGSISTPGTGPLTARVTQILED